MYPKESANSSQFELSDGSLRYMQEADLELVLRWRNSERIRSSMFSNHIISFEEHLNWFNNLDRTRNVYLLFEYEMRPVGLVNFTELDTQNSRCKWGFYIGETDVPPGTGLLMGCLSMEYIFRKISIRKLCSEVVSFNERSIRYHKKLGFQEEGLLRKHILRNGKYEDILLLALFNVDWVKIAEVIK